MPYANPQSPQAKANKLARDARYRNNKAPVLWFRTPTKKLCKCGRTLHGSSIKLGFTDCGVCRQRSKYDKMKAEQIPVGQECGVFIAEAVMKNTRNQESAP